MYERQDGTWRQVAKLTADDGQPLDSFGWSVSISGTYAIVGAHGDDDLGSAYIYERQDGTWRQAVKLTADDGQSRDGFGSSVSISSTHVIVGAVGDDDLGSYSGSAYMYEQQDGTWRQVAKLTADDGQSHDGFGDSVSISGTHAIVGAAGDDDLGSNSGSAYMYEQQDGTWCQVAKLIADDGQWGDRFGRSVSISGTYVIAGACCHYDDLGFESGSAYIYVHGIFQAPETLDLNNDGIVSLDDRAVLGGWLRKCLDYTLANLDLNNDGNVDGDDRASLWAALRQCAGDAGYIAAGDYDHDGCITFNDYRIWYEHAGIFQADYDHDGCITFNDYRIWYNRYIQAQQ